MKPISSTSAEKNLSTVLAVAPLPEIEVPDQDAPNGGLGLRHLLRMIAYDPKAIRAPREALARLRPFVIGARLKSRARHETGGTADEYARDLAQLMDGAVSGLCHIARFCADHSANSIVPPFAVVGLGEADHGELSRDPALDLLFLLPEDSGARERSGRMVAFVLTGLSDLGFNVNHASCMPAAAALLAAALPSLGARLRSARFVWGCHSLHADCGRRLPEPVNGTFTRPS